MRVLALSEQQNVVGGRQFHPAHTGPGAVVTPDLKNVPTVPLGGVLVQAYSPPGNIEFWHDYDIFIAERWVSVDDAFGASLPLVGGGGGQQTTTDAELKNGLEAVGKEASLQAFGHDVLGPFFDAAAALDIAATTMNITLSDFERDFNQYTQTGEYADGSAQGSFLPWQKLDWPLIDPNHDMTESEVIARMIKLTHQGVDIWDLD